MSIFRSRIFNKTWKDCFIKMKSNPVSYFINVCSGCGLMGVAFIGANVDCEPELQRRYGVLQEKVGVVI